MWPKKTSDMHIFFHPFEMSLSGSHMARANTVSSQGRETLFLVFYNIKVISSHI